jgi:hypothetical protein
MMKGSIGEDMAISRLHTKRVLISTQFSTGAGTKLGGKRLTCDFHRVNLPAFVFSTVCR